jgi:hypothetical protein
MMSLHLRDDCEYGEAQCPIVGCDVLLRRRDVANHVEKMHEEEKSEVEVTNGGEEEKDNEEEVRIHSKYPCRILIITYLGSYMSPCCPRVSIQRSSKNK